MKAKKSTGRPTAKRATKDLPPKKTSDAKGGSSRVMANAHEMKKALIGNIPR